MCSATTLNIVANMATFLMVGSILTPLAAAAFHSQASGVVTLSSSRRGTTKTPLQAVVESPRSSPSGFVLQDEKKNKRKTETSSKGAGRGFRVPNILGRHGRDVVWRIDTIPEYKAVVVDEKERITVVRFYAPWCRTCRAAESLFYRLAAEYGQPSDDEAGVQFVEVPVTKDNVVLHEALGVPSLPWMHIYHPEAGLVEERKGSKAHFEAVARCLKCYIRGECDMADESTCSLL